MKQGTARVTVCRKATILVEDRGVIEVSEQFQLVKPRLRLTHGMRVFLCSYAIGKLKLGNVTPDDFPGLVRQAGFDVLPLAEVDAATFDRLPRLEHSDPFD